MTLRPPPLSAYPSSLQDSASTLSQLRSLCWRVKPGPGDRRLFCAVLGSGWGVDCDEIVPGVFLGDRASAATIPFLRYAEPRLGWVVLNSVFSGDRTSPTSSMQPREGTKVRWEFSQNCVGPASLYGDTASENAYIIILLPLNFILFGDLIPSDANHML